MPEVPGENPTPPTVLPTVPDDEEMRESDPTLFEQVEDYFPSDASDAPTRVVRLTRQQLELSAQSLLGDYVSSELDATMPADPLQTNYEYAENLSFGLSNFTPYVEWTDSIASSVASNPNDFIACAESDRSCLEREARYFVETAFRSVAPPEIVDRYVQFYVDSVTEVGLAQASAELVSLTLSSPRFAFRDEVLTESSGVLLPAQLLQHITYTLADSPPSALGLSAADLATPEQLRGVIDTVLASSAARAKILGFFRAWLEIREPEAMDISPELYPEFTPVVAQAMFEETDRFLRTQLDAAIPSLRGVMSSTDSYVPADIAFIYDLRRRDADRVVAHDLTQRVGILTQPAFITSHSGPTETRLVRRGVFFTRKVMCLPLGAPVGVDTTLPEIENVTERQRVETATANGACAGCHRMINPFGFTLESYDPIGRFRTQDEHGLPIDPSIEVSFLDEGPLMATSSVEALRGFTDSMRFQQCFTRQLFRFYMGRDEESGDDPTLRQMLFQFATEDDQNILTMLRSLASSAQFARRTEER